MQLSEYKVAGLAKRVTPAISNIALARPRVQRSVKLLEAYLAILQGKGAASAWSRKGEAAAAGGAITAQRPVIVDVGAAIGDWSMLTSQRLGRPARFILVEPSEVNWPKLEAINVDGEVSLVKAACGAEEGKGTLKAVFAGAGSGSLYDRRDSFYAEYAVESTQEVPVTTVAHIAEEFALKAIDFLKVDVEGAELDVFVGAQALFEERRIRALSFEFGSGQVNSRAFFRDFWDFLTGYGFYLYCISAGGRLISIPEYDESYEYFRGVTNFLALQGGSLRSGISAGLR